MPSSIPQQRESMQDNLDKLPRLSAIGQDNQDLFHLSDKDFSNITEPPKGLENHRAFTKVFKKGKLSFSVVAPFKGYPNQAVPEVEDLAQLAQEVERLGFSAIWVRDVPFYDPNFGDAGQVYDPIATLGYLSAITKEIALGTAGLISTLREPIHTAKAAATIDRLTKERFLLGLSTGDRPVEYPAFKSQFHNREERFKESWDMIRELTQKKCPKFKGKFYGEIIRDIDLLPKPEKRLPMIAIGRARQEIKWLANTADAWIWHAVDPKDTKKIVDTLHELNNDGRWHPFGYANFIDIDKDPDKPCTLEKNIFLRAGANSLAEFWEKEREKGLAHIVLNLKPTQRPAKEILQEIAEKILVWFN